MRRVSRSRGDSALGRLEIGVGMSQAHRNAAPRGFGNDLGRALQFGSNRHHANSSARRLPEPLESRERRSQQVFRRMYPAAHMADERPFKVDPERAGAIRAIRVPVFSFEIAFAFFDRTCQPFEGAQNRIHRSGDGSGEITRDPVPRQQLFDGRQRPSVVVHDIDTPRCRECEDRDSPAPSRHRRSRTQKLRREAGGWCGKKFRGRVLRR